jgi:hypothetical protein
MKTKITEEYIQLNQGGEKIQIYKNHVQVIKETSNGNGCNIYVESFDEPFYADTNIGLINLKWDSEY